MLWPYIHVIMPHVTFDKFWEKMAGIHKHQSYVSQENLLVEWRTPCSVCCFVLQELHKCKGQGFDLVLASWADVGYRALRKLFDCWCTFDRWVGAWRTSRASGIPSYRYLLPTDWPLANTNCRVSFSVRKWKISHCLVIFKALLVYK